VVVVAAAEARSRATGAKIRDAKARADIEDNYRKTVGQALGGIVVLLGAGVAYLQFSQQQQGAHDLLISNQISKGFEQLGSNKIVIRLGGIYSLEGVMNNSDQYYRTVLESLTAFVRERTKDNSALTLTPPDIQAALTVIGRRSAGYGTVNLYGAKIAHADLSGTNLTSALTFYLTHPDLSYRGSRVNNPPDFSGANLSHADLSYADLSRVNLTGADLSGANLTHATLGYADLDHDLGGANLTGADHSGANLTHAILGAANLTGANLTDANLSYADLLYATVDRKEVDEACGSDVRLSLGEPTTLKPCPAQSPP
jgi:uncharacterized protein YjbI with pentapeptide repeats